MQKHIIIVAGGSGTRMNSAIPKQFMNLCGKPILMHTIEKFAHSVPDINIIVVLAKQLFVEWKTLCGKHRFTISYKLVEGGETRFHSVKNGLALVPENCLVGIHDAARPLVTNKIISDAFETASQKGNAIPAIPVTETIREVVNGNNKSVDRSTYFIIQTPQCFHSSQIKKAFSQEYRSRFTDEANVLESIGEKINLIEGNRDNIKITTSQDLIIAEVLSQVLFKNENLKAGC